jgi:NADH:ubiquinone oxidoreductase subunit 5 (subunit L)/multisubunit Na+/H+ antiporter MnhA subunit
LILLLIISGSKNNFVDVVYILMSLLSFLISGIISLVEEDYKKLVALRTLSQISFCVFIILIGFNLSIFTHLLSHAFIKSFLFLQVGYCIYIAFGQQIIINLSYRYLNSYNILILFFSLLSLRGLLYSSGFYRKELILGSYIILSKEFIIILFILGVFLTFIYSTRLWLGGIKLFSTSPFFRNTIILLLWAYISFVIIL